MKEKIHGYCFYKKKKEICYLLQLVIITKLLFFDNLSILGA